MKIRIMHIAQSAGGVKRYLEDFVKYSDKERYDVVLILSQDYQDSLDKFKLYIENIHIINMKRDIDILADIKSSKEIRKYYKKYKPHIIYSHSSKAGALTRISLGFKKAAIVYNAHGWSFNMKTNKKKCLAYALIEKILSFKTDIIIVISNYELQSALKRKICKSNKLKLIYNGVDVEEIKKFKTDTKKLHNELNVPEDAIVVGCVGRISRQKSPMLFVKVAKKILENNPQYFFIWVGDGEDRQLMQNLIKENNLQNNIFLTGWIDNTIEYVDLFDISVLLSEWEGFGLVLLEYMLRKKPVIATNIDAIPEIVIDNESGILLKDRKIDHISDEIVKLSKNRKLNERLVNNAYINVVSKFDIKRVVQEHEQVFEEMIRRKYGEFKCNYRM